MKIHAKEILTIHQVLLQADKSVHRVQHGLGGGQFMYDFEELREYYFPDRIKWVTHTILKLSHVLFCDDTKDRVTMFTKASFEASHSRWKDTLKALLTPKHCYYSKAELCFMKRVLEDFQSLLVDNEEKEAQWVYNLDMDIRRCYGLIEWRNFLHPYFWMNSKALNRIEFLHRVETEKPPLSMSDLYAKLK